jgi:hypothetical protein
MRRILFMASAVLVVASTLLAVDPAPKCPPEMWMTVSLTFPTKAASADLHIYDPLDRHMGMNYGTMVIDEDIPDGTLYVDPDGNQDATLETLETGTYEIELVGVDDGCYTLTIRGYENNTLVYEEVYEDCIIIEETQASDVAVDTEDENLDVDSDEPRPIPVGLATDAGCNTIGLTWNTTRGAASYRVYYDNDESGPEYEGSDAHEGISPVDVSGAESILLTGLSNDVIHYVVVTAIDSDGVESNYSAEVEATPIPLDAAVSRSRIRFSPESPFPGDPLLIDADVCCDAGSRPIDEISVQLYDGDPDGPGIQIGADQFTYGIPPGECNTVQMATLFTDPLPHAIYVRIDHQDQLWECDESNNKAFTILLPTLPAEIDLTEDPQSPFKAPGPSVATSPIFCYIELPIEYDPEDIDLRSLELSGVNGSVLPKPFPGIPWEVGDYDNDGIPDLMVTFDKREIGDIITPDEPLLTLAGGVDWPGSELCPPVDGVPFVGTDTPEKGKGDHRWRQIFLSDGTYLRVDYSNPSAEGISVTYGVGAYSHFSLKVFDAVGREVRTLASGFSERGLHDVVWDGRDSSGRKTRAGVYFCTFSGHTDGNHPFVEVRKILLLK